MLKPKYAENIIVATVYKNVFNWYVTDKELWLMDLTYDPIYCDERDNIIVLDENTAEKFLNNIKNYKMTTNQLKELFINNLKFNEEDALYNFAPSIYINFDERCLYSSYPENIFFQEYVPQKWTGEYVNISSLINFINYDNRYWIINNKSYFN